MAKKKTPDAAPSWKSKIVGHGKVDPDQITGNPFNFRKHPQFQRDALRDAIKEVGFIRSVTVNKRTGNLIDGHERLWQALNAGVKQIDVEYVDLSEEDEKKALATMDPIGELATIDGNNLELLLGDVNTSSTALDSLIDDLKSKASEAIIEDLANSGGGDDGDGDDDSADNREFVRFTVPLTVEQEQSVRVAVKHAKEKFGHESTGDALVAALIEWRCNA